MKEELKNSNERFSIQNQAPLRQRFNELSKFSMQNHPKQIYETEDYLSDLIKVLKVKSMVIGVGGAGNNTISRLRELGVEGTETVNINTDAHDLYYSNSSKKLLIGKNTCSGLGSGNNPSIGAAAAKEDVDRIGKVIDADVVFITCGLGGGTGTGAAPLIAREAKRRGSLVVSFCSVPFRSEGNLKRMRARMGMKYLAEYSDTLIPLINDNLLNIIPKSPLLTCFKVMDEILVRSIREIINLINYCGLVNIDFADVKRIFERSGDYPSGLIGITESLGEEKDIIKKARLALNNPLLQLNAKEVDQCLVSVSGNHDLSISKVDKVLSTISSELPGSANLKLGTNFDPSLGSKMRITVLGKGPISPFVKSAVDY